MENLSITEHLLTKNNDLLLHIYTLQLFVVGCVVAVGVVFLLYKAIRIFF